MVKVRVKVTGTGTRDDPFRVDLPTYIMIPGSEEYDTKDPERLVSVTVDIPADECDGDGRPSPKKIRRKYREQPRWDHNGVAKDVLAPPGKGEPIQVIAEAPTGPEPAAPQKKSRWTRLKELFKKE